MAGTRRVTERSQYAGWRVAFDVYRRRLVLMPDGRKALVAIRRNIDVKPDWWNSFDSRWEAEGLGRLLRRDPSWRVEVYVDVDEDPVASRGERPTACLYVPTSEEQWTWPRMCQPVSSVTA